MNLISKEELISIMANDDPIGASHNFIMIAFEKNGYDETQKLMRQALLNSEFKNFNPFLEKLIKEITRNEKFELFRSTLLAMALNFEYDELEIWVQKASGCGLSKFEIYNILLELFVFLRFDLETKVNEDLSDNLADFLDRFTAWNSRHRILPDEPDIRPTGAPPVI